MTWTFSRPLKRRRAARPAPPRSGDRVAHRTYEIPAIFTEVNGSDSTAQAIARETGVAVCPLSMIMSGDGDGLDSYCDAISENVETIVNALSEGQVRVQ